MTAPSNPPRLTDAAIAREALYLAGSIAYLAAGVACVAMGETVGGLACITTATVEGARWLDIRSRRRSGP
jgi:hypothetical protein